MAEVLPLPFVWPQQNVWLGLDGDWSTFPLSVGTPLQHFNVLPSISGTQTWLPVEEGCAWVPLTFDCAASRGVDISTGSRGFRANTSSTWQQLGLFGLGFEEELYGKDENGLYGLDAVAIGVNASAPTIGDQVIAGIGSAEFWIGSLGLSNVASSLAKVNRELPSLPSTLHTKQIVPSQSFGYAAGAAYKNATGSLILGGYDAASIKSTNLSFAIADDGQLLVDLAGIVSTGSLHGTVSMLGKSSSLTMRLDSAVAQLWLPASVCNMMTMAFGLVYDEPTNLYLVNNTIHAKLQQLNPETTFTLASRPATSSNVNIVFPYAAFDLTIGLPVYNTTYHYFPIRKADNETQYVLGRTFLQEAYLIADWGRSSFALGQAVYGSPQSIVPVTTPAAAVAAYRLSSGGIAGIVIGCVFLAAIVAMFYWWRKAWHRQQKFSDQHDAHMTESPYLKEHRAELSGEKTGVEIMSSSLHELADGPKPALQIMSKEVFELDATSPSQELESAPVCLPAYDK